MSLMAGRLINYFPWGPLRGPGAEAFALGFGPNHLGDFETPQALKGFNSRIQPRKSQVLSLIMPAYWQIWTTALALLSGEGGCPPVKVGDPFSHLVFRVRSLQYI